MWIIRYIETVIMYTSVTFVVPTNKSNLYTGLSVLTGKVAREARKYVLTRAVSVVDMYLYLRVD